MSGPPCAAAGCANPVERQPGRLGRPPIYCSPECRPSRTACTSRNQASVEVDQEDHDGHRPGRCWTVRLRRGKNSVVVGRDLGHFSATMLSDDLRNLLQPSTRQKGAAIE